MSNHYLNHQQQNVVQEGKCKLSTPHRIFMNTIYINVNNKYMAIDLAKSYIIIILEVDSMMKTSVCTCMHVLDAGGG